MKSIFSFVIIVSFGCIACGGSAETGDKKTTDVTQNPAYQKGFALVKQSDCLTCHQVDAKGIGPSYKDIAQKYADAGADQLIAVSQKIISGGAGVWGQVPMTAHPALSAEDAKAMLDYILLLK